ncbi:MAG: diguanylate cyclase domain-containing protein [Alcanivoracaceae bacterium]
MSGKPAVLVVDDQPANRIALEALLDDFDIELLQAASGEEALHLLKDHDVAVVLLDVQMPGMDGYEVATLMQQGIRTRAVPIIFVTAINRDLEHVMKGYASGAVDFLTKPINSEMLQGKVRVFLELDRRGRELVQANNALTRSLQEVERLKHHNELLLKSIGEGILSLDRRGNIIFANPAAHALLGQTGTIIGNPLASHVSGPASTRSLDEMLKACLAGERWNGVTTANRQHMNFPAEIIATPLKDDKGFIAGVSIAFQDVSERQQRENELRRESERDPLTGLINRRGLERLLPRRIAYGAQKLALLYLDLDRFKEVNDSHGHHAGDVVLKAISDRFQHAMRQSDLIARVGGDEFCIVVSADAPHEAAETVARKLLEISNEPLACGNVSVVLGASIGIALPDGGSLPEVLMRRADEAMYQAKRKGGNCYQVAE